MKTLELNVLIETKVPNCEIIREEYTKVSDDTIEGTITVGRRSYEEVIPVSVSFEMPINFYGMEVVKCEVIGYEMNIDIEVKYEVRSNTPQLLEEVK